MRRGWLALLGAVVVAVLGVFLLVRPGAAPAPSGTAAVAENAATSVVPGAAESKLPVKPLSALPPEAAQVWAQIKAGGPFAYERDGITFGNREGLLPSRPNGYYHEYTVPTPGERDRGARRLVTGGDRGPGQELYYTGDHYDSFVVVDTGAAA
jgi:ribonuclease T1